MHNTAQEPNRMWQPLHGVEPLPIVWGIVVDIETHGNDPVRVYRGVTSIVVLPDVLHLDRAADATDLVDVLRVVEQVWVFPKELLVALEVNGVNLPKRLESNHY